MNIETILKENNKSVTQERIEIFSYAEKKHLFSSQDLLLHFKNLGRASIFRTLNLFLEIGIIRRISLEDRIEMYEIIHEEHHHEHMKCEKCNKIISFESEDICKKIFEEAKKLGFSIKEHSVIVRGLCKNCSLIKC